MTSRERMLAALECRAVDHVPCSFMLFFNLLKQSRDEAEFVRKQVEMGLDAFVRVGCLKHALHPEARESTWIEEHEGYRTMCRRIDTPKGPLTQRVRQDQGWPREDQFPIFNDWNIGRSKEFLVNPEQDLERLKYVFGPFRDEDIRELRDRAQLARQLARQHGLLQVGGWQPTAPFGPRKGKPGRLEPPQFSDAGVMGCDAMSWLSGYEQVMVLSLTRPDVVREYANIIHEWNLRQIQVYLEVTEADVIWRRGWYETTEFWTPDAYRNIINPTLKKEADFVHQAGRKYGYIITSAFMPLLDDILATGIDVLIGLDPEEGKGTDLGAVKKRFRAARRAIWGGVSGAITVELGTEAQTEKAVKTALEVLGEGSGFVLSPVDNVREDTETAWRNTRAFVEAWKRWR